VVRYFLMRVDHGDFAPNDEVDEVSWCPLTIASWRLSYPRDHDVLVAAGAVTW
jgi:hypothetical protein